MIINKKGQMTIIVIVAVLIAVAIGIIAAINKTKVYSNEGDFDNPEYYMSSCVKKISEEVLEKMLVGGGFVNSNNTVLYNTKKITYLCKNINNFDPCINQHPLYIQQIEKEFEDKIKIGSEKCFNSLKQNLIDKNYEVSGNFIDIESVFKSGVIEIAIKNDLTIKNKDFSRTFSRFDTYIRSEILGIGFVVNEILAQEAKYCYFSNDGFMALYPEYDIRVYMMEEATEIYTIENKNSKEVLKMAVRGCAMPTGWF